MCVHLITVPYNTVDYQLISDFLCLGKNMKRSDVLENENNDMLTYWCQSNSISSVNYQHPVSNRNKLWWLSKSRVCENHCENHNWKLEMLHKAACWHINWTPSQEAYSSFVTVCQCDLVTWGVQLTFYVMLTRKVGGGVGGVRLH